MVKKANRQDTRSRFQSSLEEQVIFGFSLSLNNYTVLESTSSAIKLFSDVIMSVIVRAGVRNQFF